MTDPALIALMMMREALMPSLAATSFEKSCSNCSRAGDPGAIVEMSMANLIRTFFTTSFVVSCGGLGS